jgi:hypothetical protein
MTTKTAERPTPAERLAQLEQERAARKDELDICVRTQREFDAYVEATLTLDRRIAQLRNAIAACADLGSPEADEQWLDRLTTWRKALCAERLTIKSPIRDREIKRQAEDLEWSIQLIDRGFGMAKLGIETIEPTRIGQLMQQAGYAVSGPTLRGPHGWQGSLPETEARIKDLTQRRAAAQAALDALLLTAEERAAQEAAAQARREALNTLEIKISGDSTGLVAYKDGERLDPASMTEAQRQALAWAERAFVTK